MLYQTTCSTLFTVEPKSVVDTLLCPKFNVYGTFDCVPKLLFMTNLNIRGAPAPPPLSFTGAFVCMAYRLQCTFLKFLIVHATRDVKMFVHVLHHHYNWWGKRSHSLRTRSRVNTLAQETSAVACLQDS